MKCRPTKLTVFSERVWLHSIELHANYCLPWSSVPCHGRRTRSHWPLQNLRLECWLVHLQMCVEVPLWHSTLSRVVRTVFSFFELQHVSGWLIRKLVLWHADQYLTRCSSRLVHFHRRSFVHLSCFVSSDSKDSRRAGNGLWQRTVWREATESGRSVVTFNLVSKPVDTRLGWWKVKMHAATIRMRIYRQLCHSEPDETAMASSLVQALDHRQWSDGRTGNVRWLPIPLLSRLKYPEW